MDMRLLVLLLLAARTCSALAPRRLLAPARRQSPPMALAFDVSATTAAPDLPKWLGDGGEDGRGVQLLPGGYTQSSGGERANSATVLAGGEPPAFSPVGAGGAGAYAPLLRLELANGGAMQPMDVGAPIVQFTASLKPVALHGGPDAPPATDAFDITFSVMWSPGSGAPPNNAGVFNLVHPLPFKEFVAFGVPHKFTITGLRLPAGAAPELKAVRPWWNKDTPEEAGSGAVLVPMDGAKYVVELLAEVHVI